MFCYEHFNQYQSNMNLLRLFSTVIIAFFGILFLGKSFPIQELNQQNFTIISIFRFSYSFLVIIRLIRGWKAIPLLHGWQKEKSPKVLRYMDN